MKKIFTILLLFFLLTVAQACFAGTVLENLTKIGGGAGYANPGSGTTLISQTVGKVVAAFFTLLGIIFIILIIYAGYTYMTARGEEQKVERALATIRRAIIGLIITAGSYAIWLFVYNTLIK
jgi:cytochrome bd-type quinol oxidase subunit 2